MVTSVSLRNFTWGDGVQVTANDLRLQMISGRLTGAAPSGSTGISARPGVRYGIGNPLLVSASSGMTISINAGFAYVQGSVSGTAGMYEGCLDTTSTLTVTTSDPTNPRIDNVHVRFVDNGDNTSTGTVTIQAGTPAPSPVAPVLPANSLLLATIAVGAGVSSITSGNITDARVYTVAVGGILPLANLTGSIPGPGGMYVHDLSNGRLKVTDGAGTARQVKIGSFGGTSAQISGNVATNTTGFTTICQVSVGVDGTTELEVYAAWTGVVPPAGATAGDFIQLGLLLDGTAGMIAGGGAPTIQRIDSNSPNTGSGGSLRNWCTPSNGVHTLSLVAWCNGHAYSLTYPFIRVAPSLQQ